MLLGDFNAHVGSREYVGDQWVSVREPHLYGAINTLASQQQRWRRHFTEVLNTRSQYQAAEIEKVRQRDVDEELGRVPSSNEVAKALVKLKNGKALRYFQRCERWVVELKSSGG